MNRHIPPQTFFLIALLSLLLSSFVPTKAQTCVEPLNDARRLVLVTTNSMATFRATVQLFERSSADALWRPVRNLGPAVIGRSGLAWGRTFRNLARSGEPFKAEGDRRTPAGVYRVGRRFGFSSSSRPGYLHLKTGQTVCVDDPSSPAYNTIVTRAAIGSKIHGEDMRGVGLYRNGLVVDYPTDAARKDGSCIFIHIWRGSDRGTVGCIALTEEKVETLQDFADDGAVIAILPDTARARFGSCLPEAAATLPP
jgi:L,D-peptidoglycan transpeptidase YkuD (ErfK/YbiS/YcfS/YnhG family)